MTVSRWQMAKTFFRIGATSYGGPAIVAQIREVTVLQKNWLSDEEFRESLAFAQMLPGPTAVQTAAHIGWRLHRTIGTYLALISYTLPAFLLMLGLSAAYFHFEQMPAVATAFRGLGAAVVAIVVHSILSMAQPALQDWRGLLIAAAAAWGFFANADTLLVLLAAALGGVILLFIVPREPSPAPTGANGSPARADRRSGYARVVAGLAALTLAYAAVVAGSRWVSPKLPALGVTLTKINLLAFGGGYTALALMFREVVHNPAHAWLTPKQFIDGLALGQITPGPVSVTATFIGYRVGGVLGAAFATTCIFFPSSVLLGLLAPHFARFRHLHVVQSAICGLLAAFIAMLLHVLAEVAKSAFLGSSDVLLAASAIVALRLKLNVVWVVVGSVLVSLVLARL